MRRDSDVASSLIKTHINSIPYELVLIKIYFAVWHFEVAV